MEKFVRRWGVLVGLVLAVVCGVGASQEVLAEEDVSFQFAITPTVTTFETMKPGESYEGTFEVLNRGSESLVFTVVPKPYSIVNEKYDSAYDQETQYTEITNWITASIEDGSIEPGERARINFTVTVPKDAHGGSQSAVIMVRTAQERDGEGSGVTMAREVGHLVYGNVDGETVQTGEIIENRVPGFLFNPPIAVTALVENTGNVYGAMTHTVQMWPLFSDEEVWTNEEEPVENIVFPETKRYSRLAWDGAPQLGVFRVRSVVTIFDEESVMEKIVILCPIWFLFVVALLVFCMIFWVVSRVVRRKKES